MHPLQLEGESIPYFFVWTLIIIMVTLRFLSQLDNVYLAKTAATSGDHGCNYTERTDVRRSGAGNDTPVSSVSSRRCRRGWQHDSVDRRNRVGRPVGDTYSEGQSGGLTHLSNERMDRYRHPSEMTRTCNKILFCSRIQNRYLNFTIAGHSAEEGYGYLSNANGDRDICCNYNRVYKVV